MASSLQNASVFISHSHQDNELVRDLARRLCEAGFKPIVDLADLPLGDGWKTTVAEKIRAADAMLILVTPAALQSGWMMRELGFAEGLERFVVPVTVGVKPRDLPAPLHGYQITPFDEADRAIDALSEHFTPAAKR